MDIVDTAATDEWATNDRRLTRPVSMSLDAATVHRLEILAHELDRSRSWVVRKAVAEMADKEGVTR